MYLQRDLCDLLNHRANLQQSWTPSTGGIVDTETCYLPMFLLITWFAVPATPSTSCHFAVQDMISFILCSSENMGEQLTISWESGISSFPMYHSIGLWQSVQCVWFLSYQCNKLPIFIGCFSQATFQQRRIICVQLCWFALVGSLCWYTFPLSHVVICGLFVKLFQHIISLSNHDLTGNLW